MLIDAVLDVVTFDVLSSCRGPLLRDLLKINNTCVSESIKVESNFGLGRLLLVTVLKVDHDGSGTNVIWLGDHAGEHELRGDYHSQSLVLLPLQIQKASNFAISVLETLDSHFRWVDWVYGVRELVFVQKHNTGFCGLRVSSMDWFMFIELSCFGNAATCRGPSALLLELSIECHFILYHLLNWQDRERNVLVG